MDLTGRIFVTADTHFGDSDAVDRFGRRHPDVRDMDDRLVTGINRMVGPDDLLFHLGDFTGRLSGSRTRHAQAIRERLECERIVLIRGNHVRIRPPTSDVSLQ